jgi:hypothetical protein
LLQAERSAIRGAASVLTASGAMREHLRREHGDLDQVTVLTNGYSPEDFAAVQPALFDRFTFMYAGNFHPPIRSITPFLEALRLALSRRPDLRGKLQLVYHGDHGYHVRDQADRNQVADVVNVGGRIGRAEVLSCLRGADQAIVVTTVHSNGSLEERGVVTAKLFEPLGLGTPVLLITPERSDARTILESARCGRAFHGEETEAMAEFIIARVSGADDGLENCDPTAYSWPTLGARLDEVLRGVI